jgi:hypothetical protein
MNSKHLTNVPLPPQASPSSDGMGSSSSPPPPVPLLPPPTWPPLEPSAGTNCGTAMIAAAWSRSVLMTEGWEDHGAADEGDNRAQAGNNNDSGGMNWPRLSRHSDWLGVRKCCVVHGEMLHLRPSHDLV